MSEFDAPRIATDVEGRNCRNMEPCQHQYVGLWNGHVYIYAIRRQLRKSGYFKHYRRWSGLTDISNHCKFILPEYHRAGTPFNIEGRNNRNMESVKHQYDCPWNDDLYIYAIRGQLRDAGFFGYHHCEYPHANI
jgi:hypothetical protein